MNIIAIDPGKTGAIAVYNNGETLLYDVPLRRENSKKVIDIPTLIRIFTRIKKSDAIGVIEKVHSMPTDGNVSAFNFGETFGILKTLLHCICREVVEIPPMKWKRRLQLNHATKNDSRALAMKLYPAHKPDLCRASDHNRAEALLILSYFLYYRSF